MKPNQQICVIDRDGEQRNGRILQVLGFHGLKRVEVPSAQAGDIIAVTGVDNLRISDTLCDRSTPEALPTLTVDEPTISMRMNSTPSATHSRTIITGTVIMPSSNVTARGRDVMGLTFLQLILIQLRSGEQEHLYTFALVTRA